MAIRAALIGCGKIGQRHLQALVHQNAIELVATVDTNQEQAEAAAVAFDADAFTDTAVMLDKADVDAAVIATPSGLHRDLAIQVMERGKHVMVEKPLALTYHDAKAIVDMAHACKVIAVVTQFNRMLPTVEQLFQAHQEGRLGRIVDASVALRWSRPQSYYDEAPWRGTLGMDGGVLFNQAIHAIDVLLQMMGPVAEVFAYTATLSHQIEAEDSVAGTMRFESGVLATVAATTCVPKTNLEERLTIVGENGVVVIGPTVNQIETWRVGDDDEDDLRQRLLELPSRPGWQSHHDALKDFADAITEGNTPRLDAGSALDGIAVIEGLMRSGREGRVVMMSEITGEGV